MREHSRRAYILAHTEGHSGIIQGLDRVETRLEHMEKENKRQHLETRALCQCSTRRNDPESIEAWIKPRFLWCLKTTTSFTGFLNCSIFPDVRENDVLSF